MRKSGAAPTYLTPSQAVSSPRFHSALWAADTTQEDVDSMRAGAIKQELESYGISTKVFLEKEELVEALKKARADGLKPKETSSTSSESSSKDSSSSSKDSSSSSSSSTSSSSEKSTDSRPRDERLKEEISNCEKMKNSELKQELTERGVSTAAFFEKSEFVEALAAARVDGVSKKGGQSKNSNEEGYAEYADVEVLTDDSTGPRATGAGQQQKQQQQQQQQQSSPFGGGSPFGGPGGNPFGGAGGMGGMGGFADMLKNMQGMGGAGGGGNANADPFGGAGGNPFAGGMGGMGDAMGKAQEMMKNPKVMELTTKAQKNPKIMKAMQECMSNPAAMSKYQDDPEVAELINELRKYM
jgi:hypothetical protein